MTLVAATPDIIQADLAGRDDLAEALGIDVPDNWPPELFDTPVMWAYRDQLRDPEAHGWSAWYLLFNGESEPQLAGLCAFKGRPDRAGRRRASRT